MPKRIQIDDIKLKNNHADKAALKGKKVTDLKPQEQAQLLVMICRKLGLVDANDVIL